MKSEEIKQLEAEIELDEEWVEIKPAEYPVIDRYLTEEQKKEIRNRAKKGGETNMVSLKEEAQAYEPKQTLNVADLEKVDISLDVEERSGTDGEGKEFKYKVLVVEGKEYRVPNTVLEEIKKIVTLRPETKFVKVTKSGSGLSTRYSVEVAE